jgi:rRNA-processing protein FCF1
VSVVVVDAANVVGSRPDGWWRDRAGAARRLLAELERLPGRALAGAVVQRVVVVLEGRAREGAAERDGVVAVQHAPGAGDDALVALCRPGVVLVTADRELGERAQARGAEVVGPQLLRAALS